MKFGDNYADSKPGIAVTASILYHITIIKHARADNVAN
jgi:hypothetical protein